MERITKMKKINVEELRELFIEIKYGNNIAFEKLYKNYKNLVYKIAYSILKKTSFTEIVMQKNFTFIFKFLFLKYKAIFLIQSIIDADNMERRRQQFKDH